MSDPGCEIESLSRALSTLSATDTPGVEDRKTLGAPSLSSSPVLPNDLSLVLQPAL